MRDDGTRCEEIRGRANDRESHGALELYRGTIDARHELENYKTRTN